MENKSSYSLAYEKWPFDNYAIGYDSWNLYKDGKIIAAMANNNDNDGQYILIRSIRSLEKGAATILLFMLLDLNCTIITGKPEYNSTTVKGYYWKKKIVKIIEESNYKYGSRIIGFSVNRDDSEEFEPIYHTIDNYHYKFWKNNF